jgi:hypothetical protein
MRCPRRKNIMTYTHFLLQQFCLLCIYVHCIVENWRLAFSFWSDIFVFSRVAHARCVIWPNPQLFFILMLLSRYHFWRSQRERERKRVREREKERERERYCFPLFHLESIGWGQLGSSLFTLAASKLRWWLRLQFLAWDISEVRRMMSRVYSSIVPNRVHHKHIVVSFSCSSWNQINAGYNKSNEQHFLLYSF